MRGLAAALLVLLALGSLEARAAAAAGQYTLVVPRAPHADEALAVQVRVGVLQHGSEIDVTSGGVLLGTVSPFAIRGGHEAGTYTVPLAGVNRRGARVAIRLTLTHFGNRPRAPTAQEVRSVRLVYLDVTN
jgi:hypothetical protein